MFRVKKLEKTPETLAILKELAEFLEPKIKERFLKDQKDREKSAAEKKKKKEDAEKFKDGHEWSTEINSLITLVIKAMSINKGFDFEYVVEVVKKNPVLGISDYNFAE